MPARVAKVEKVIRTNEFYIERNLPDLGQILVTLGQEVQPFTKIGQTKVSFFFEKINPEFTISRRPNEYIEKGVDIAKAFTGRFTVKKLIAPYNGFIRRVGDGTYIYEQDKENFDLYAGTWGKVVGIVENKSILLKGSATTVYCAISTPFEAEGEMVVLPNPTELLEDPYFNNFTKDTAGKIIYAGYSIKLENVKKAIDAGVRGIITGGVDKSTFDYALRNSFMLASISGFGRIPTPDIIYRMLGNVVNRYIFVRGQTGQVIIPSEKPFDEPKWEGDYVAEIKTGMIVQVLERPYFGWTGIVSKVDEDQVEVSFTGKEDVFNVSPTNLMAVSF